jgi:vacuolar-type H+-ATPase subunit H
MRPFRQIDCDFLVTAVSAEAHFSYFKAEILLIIQISLLSSATYSGRPIRAAAKSNFLKGAVIAMTGMDAVVQSLKDWKESADRVTQQAVERRGQLLSLTHIEAAHRIEGIKEKNAQSLRELAAHLREENEEKERVISTTTGELMELQRRNGEAHLADIVDFLYLKVVTVE